MRGLSIAPGAPPPSADLSAAAVSAQGLVHDLVVRLPVLGLGAAVFVLSIVVAHVARWSIKRATRRNRRANLGIVVGRLTYFATVIVGGLVAVTIVAPSMTPARLVSLLGIGGVAIGFAFKDIFQNMLAGVLILWQEPFRVGDEITSGGFTGAVEAIETRATLVKTYDGKRIIIPNSQIYTEPVSVISVYDMLRSEYDVGIGYGDNVGKAKEILSDILHNIDGILAEPAPELIVWDLAASTVNLRIRWWTKPDRPTVVHVRGRVLEQVRERLPAAGIDLPYPTQVMLFHDQTDETDGDRARQREGWPAGENPPSPARIAMAIERAGGARADARGRDETTRASRMAPALATRTHSRSGSVERIDATRI